MRRAIVFAILVLPLFAGPVPAADSDDISRQEAFERSLLEEHGLAPLESALATGREIHQVIFLDPYRMLRMPGLEVERHPDNRVMLTVFAPAGRLGSASLAINDWMELERLEANTFVEKAARDAEIAEARREPVDPDAPPPQPPPICHGWSTLVATTSADGERRVWGSQCSGDTPEALHYAAEFARLAVVARPQCTFDEGNPFWSFDACLRQLANRGNEDADPADQAP